MLQVFIASYFNSLKLYTDLNSCLKFMCFNNKFIISTAKTYKEDKIKNLRNIEVFTAKCFKITKSFYDYALK